MLIWNRKMKLNLINCLKSEADLVKYAIDFILLIERKKSSQFTEIEFSRLLIEKELIIFKEIKRYSQWEKN
jgi:hypothetical protein